MKNQYVYLSLIRSATVLYKDPAPGPHLMRIHLVRNSTSARFWKSPKIHLVRHIIHLVRILPIIHLVQKFALSE